MTVTAPSAWYVDPIDRIDTIDIDPDFDGYLAADFTGDDLYEDVSAVSVLTPVPEDGGVAVISEASLNAGLLVFRAVGSGVLVTFRLTGSGAIRSNDWTCRLRAREA